MNEDPLERRGHGLALFMTRGMSAWFDALKIFQPRPMTHYPPTPESSQLPHTMKSEVILVLTDMILACQEEKCHA